MKNLIRKLIDRIGYNVAKIIPSDISSNNEFMELYALCKPYTMTSVERMYSLYLSVKYVLDNNIKGDFVECGVWKGGSTMLIASYLQLKGFSDRKIYLYDTFEGMTKPEEVDSSASHKPAIATFLKKSTSDDSSSWCFSAIDEVQRNLLSTGINKESLVFVKGKVEDTIPKTSPNQIVLLRLDTDWYKSTKHELIHLYPLLSKLGVLIVDDFGYWKGCKKAVLEFFKERKEHPLFNRIDGTGICLIKLRED